jgi:predicted nucleotide-binding protein (sugar kinase/HSP70/actin superfamily)
MLTPRSVSYTFVVYHIPVLSHSEDACTSALADVSTVVTKSGFRKLRSTLNDRATNLLLELESISREGDVNVGVIGKYMVKADDLANHFMESNNVVVRTPLNHKKGSPISSLLSFFV